MEIKDRAAAERETDRSSIPYEPPLIITYSGDDILAEIGPALACSPTPCTNPPSGTPLSTKPSKTRTPGR